MHIYHTTKLIYTITTAKCTFEFYAFHFYLASIRIVYLLVLSLERSICMSFLLSLSYCLHPSCFWSPSWLFQFSEVHIKAFLVGVSEFSLIRCPRHKNLLTLITNPESNLI